MSAYGRRYLSANEFCSYCSDLNIPLDSSELEHYERAGVLLPVAQVVKPDEYVIERRRMNQQAAGLGQKLPNWDELERILNPDRRTVPTAMTSADLYHPFDREFERHNRFLGRCTAGEFKPWSSFRVRVDAATGDGYEMETAEHYYHYWQVHQVLAIQQKYPLFAKHPGVFKHLKDEAKAKLSYLWPSAGDVVSTLSGKAECFDALSFYIEMYVAEEGTTLDTTPTQGGVKHLTDEQFERYQSRQAEHAKHVLHRYGLTTSQLYEFLVHLLDLRATRERDERLKLAADLGNDLVFLTRLIGGVSGQTIDEMAEEVGKRAPFWAKQQFRHLDRATQVRDYAQETFERLMNNYNTEFPSFSLSTVEIRSLLDFIEMTGLFIIPYTVFDIDEVLNNPRAFRRTSLYIGVKNLATGLECLLREIARRVPNATGSMETLYRLIGIVFPQWYGEFQREQCKRQKATKPSDFIWNITDAYNDRLLGQTIQGHIIRIFLIAYWARNLTAHYYTLEDDFYRDLYGRVYIAICHAMFYTWEYAVHKGWIT